MKTGAKIGIILGITAATATGVYFLTRKKKDATTVDGSTEKPDATSGSKTPISDKVDALKSAASTITSFLKKPDVKAETPPAKTPVSKKTARKEKRAVKKAARKSAMDGAVGFDAMPY